MHQKTDTHEPWRPGVLGAGICYTNPAGGVHQQLLMMLITRARQRDMDTMPLEILESTISVADDAIEHMMRKSQ